VLKNLTFKNSNKASQISKVRLLKTPANKTFFFPNRAEGYPSVKALSATTIR
jgi:hypothetical protein